MPDYRYLAADLKTGTIREEIPFDTVTYGRGKNAPAPFFATIRVDHAKATPENLDPSRTIVYVERDGRIVADGILWTTNKTPESRDLVLAGQSLWSYFRRRLIRHTQTFSGVDQLQIFRDLIDYAQSQPGGNLGIQVDTANSGILRERSYPAYERKNLGEACEQLAGVEGGFDFEGDCGWENGEIVRRIHLGYPRRGRRTEFVFEWGVNLEDYGHMADGQMQSNLVDAVGQGEGESMVLATATDPNVLVSYPLLEEALPLKDVSRRDTLQGHADARLRARRVPVETPSLVVQPSGQPPFSSYIPGDEMRIRIDDGHTRIDGWFSMQSYQVTVDENGDEEIRMFFAGSDQV